MSLDQEQTLNDYLCFLHQGLPYDEKAGLFQRLIDHNMVGEIESTIQNMVANFISSGECTPKQEVEETDNREMESINA
jgi:hypothetical protein